MRRMTRTAAVIASLSIALPTAGLAAVDVDININGYLPPPPGVHILMEAGRPYYVANNQRIYVVEKRKHDNGKHRGYERKGEGHGRKQGHGKKDRDD